MAAFLRPENAVRIPEDLPRLMCHILLSEPEAEFRPNLYPLPIVPHLTFLHGWGLCLFDLSACIATDHLDPHVKFSQPRTIGEAGGRIHSETILSISLALSAGIQPEALTYKRLRDLEPGFQPTPVGPA